MMLRRIPIESSRPLELLGVVRLAAAAVALIPLLVLDLPWGGDAALVVGLVLVPWAIAILALAHSRPELVVGPWVGVVDIGLLALVEVAVPETHMAVRFAVLFLLCVHASFQGERGGLALAAYSVAMMWIATAIGDDGPVMGDQLVFDEAIFAIACFASALMIGRLRTAESASRLRARGLSRRTIQAESEVRRRVAESIHDGPVQELIGLDMMLSAARRAASDGDPARAQELIDEARELAERNIQALRDEIVDLGPYAFEELSFATAVENCMPTWKRRYGIEVLATLQRIECPPELAGGLFRITQEAVNNVGRHAHAKTVSLSLRSVDDQVELRITDDGEGFDDAGDPLAAAEPGHLGLASMRERAELIGGRLSIETSEKGTRVLVLAPLDKQGAAR